MRIFFLINVVVIFMNLTGGCYCRNTEVFTDYFDKNQLQKDTFYFKVTNTGFRLYCIPNIPENLYQKGISPDDIILLKDVSLYLVADIMEKDGQLVYEWAPEAITEIPIKYKIGDREFDADIKSEILFSPPGHGDSIVIESRVIGKTITLPGMNIIRAPLTVIANKEQNTLVIPLLDEIRLFQKESDACAYYSGAVIIR